MQRGDLVKLAQCAPAFGMFIVVTRMMGWDGDRFDDDSPFAQWKIINVQSGKVFTQAARELEVISNASS